MRKIVVLGTDDISTVTLDFLKYNKETIISFIICEVFVDSYSQVY